MTATIMDANGKKVATQKFSAGWRVWVGGAKVTGAPDGPGCIELSPYHINTKGALINNLNN
jgi:hypothetical protein